MWELYLLSRIGVIHSFFIGIAISSAFIALIMFAISVTTDDFSGENICNEHQQKRLRKTVTKFIYCFITALCIAVVTPTTDQAYFIYGVGGSIDYLKTNDKAKQIPDKCIDALDKWVDSLIDKEEKGE